MTALLDVCPYRVDVIICCISLSHVPGQCFLKSCLTNRMCVEKYTCLWMNNCLTFKTCMTPAVINITRLLLAVLTALHETLPITVDDKSVCLWYISHSAIVTTKTYPVCASRSDLRFEITRCVLMCALVYLCWLCVQSSFAVTYLLSRGTYCEKDVCYIVHQYVSLNHLRFSFAHSVLLETISQVCVQFIELLIKTHTLHNLEL